MSEVDYGAAIALYREQNVSAVDAMRGATTKEEASEVVEGMRQYSRRFYEAVMPQSELERHLRGFLDAAKHAIMGSVVDVPPHAELVFCSPAGIKPMLVKLPLFTAAPTAVLRAGYAGTMLAAAATVALRSQPEVGLPLATLHVMSCWITECPKKDGVGMAGMSRAEYGAWRDECVVTGTAKRFESLSVLAVRYDGLALNGHAVVEREPVDCSADQGPCKSVGEVEVHVKHRDFKDAKANGGMDPLTRALIVGPCTGGIAVGGAYGDEGIAAMEQHRTLMNREGPSIEDVRRN